MTARQVTKMFENNKVFSKPNPVLSL